MRIECCLALGLLISSCLRAAPAVTREEAYAELIPAEETAIVPREAGAEGLEGRVLSGYQGWFRAEGDGSGLGFHHYSRQGRFEPGRCGIDLWPDLAGFDEDETYPTPFMYPDGTTARVFSSLNPKTVDRHFRWMAEHGIDGVFVQRFGVLAAKTGSDPRYLAADNRKLRLCRDAAIRHGRCHALMYDLTGLADEDFDRLAADWKELRGRMRLGMDPNDPSYLRFRGKPLVAVWGIGFNDGRAYGLDRVEWFLRLLKHNPEWGGMSVLVGVPYGWQTLDRDSVADLRLHEVLKLADVVSPWSVGRYATPEQARDAGERIRHDLAWCRERDLGYLPVVFPGFSWHNLRGGEAPLNSIPRLGGRFLWSQFLAAKGAGATAAYVAMFDELDEATAIIPCRQDPPDGGGSVFVPYERDVTPDHYLWLCGEGGRLLRGELPQRPGQVPSRL